MTNDKPPVAPVEGFYAMLRNGMVVGPLFKAYPEDMLMTYELSCEVMEWKPDGTGHGMRPEYDIIATISPADLALAIEIGKMPAVDVSKALAADPIKQKSLESRLARMTDIQKRTHKRSKKLEALTPLADAVCDYADANCRAFPIATAPRDEWFLAWDDIEGDWDEITRDGLIHPMRNYTHWRPLPPPPSNPPLPAVFVELGAALEKLKGA
jgi:hypothetical protein